MNAYDVIVIGAGGMGSAAAYHIARRGARVLGLEQFSVPNNRGSSHGHSRIIRLAYWEDPIYVPLLQRAFILWRELEGNSGKSLLVITGSIDAGARGSRPIRGVLEACDRFGLPHETMDSQTLSGKFPGYRLPSDMVAVFQPDGGYLLSEDCIVAHANLATRFGAQIHSKEKVIDWESRGGHVVVRTQTATYEANRLVITAGPWAGKVVKALQPLVTPERQVVMWTTPVRPEWFQPATFPVFYMHGDDGSFYGFPMVGEHGFKIGKYHHRLEVADPDALDDVFHPEDEELLRRAVQRYFPDADGPTAAHQTCLFTNTRDEHFIIDLLPESSSVCIAAGFSGHGYKFCSVVGEILADLALDGKTRHDISLFSMSRLLT